MACRWNAVVVPALLALASVCAAQGKGALRGLRPDLVDKYKPVRGKFKCLDGSATIDFNLVNDNFCDCLDGSDEPGTSACPNGQFYCRNRGHEAKVISSAFVDDGICDCCDGSDEVGGCKNTCIEKNSKVREELHAKVDAYKAALHTRQQYSEAATAKLEAMKTRLAGIDDEIAAADNEYKRLEAEKSTVLAEEAAKAQVLADKGVPVPSPDAPLAPPPEDDEAELESHEWADEGAAGEGEPSPYDQADEGEVLAEEAEEAEEDAVPGVEEEETEEERGRRIAAQWTKDPEAAGVPVGEAGEAGAAAADQEPGAGVSDGGGADAQAAAPAVEDPDVTELLALRFFGTNGGYTATGTAPRLQPGGPWPSGSTSRVRRASPGRLLSAARREQPPQRAPEPREAVCGGCWVLLRQPTPPLGCVLPLRAPTRIRPEAQQQALHTWVAAGSDRGIGQPAAMRMLVSEQP